FRRRHGGDARRSAHAGLVAHHRSDAGAARLAQEKRMVGADGRRVPPRLKNGARKGEILLDQAGFEVIGAALGVSGMESHLAPRRPADWPVPPVLDTAGSRAWRNGLSTVIWPSAGVSVQKHSQDLPAMVRMPQPLSLPTFCASFASNTSLVKVRRSPALSPL